MQRLELSRLSPIIYTKLHSHQFPAPFLWLWLYCYFLTSRCPRSMFLVSTRAIITAIPVPILIELTRMYITIALSTIVSLRDCCPLMGMMTVM